MLLAIKNATLLTVTKGVIENGTLLIEDGKIAALGQDVVVPAAAQVIDAKGGFVCPGFVDAHTALGLKEDSTRWEGADHNEITNPVVPHMRALDGFNPHDEALPTAREGGVTTTLVSPGTLNVLGGIAAVFKTSQSDTADAMYVKEFAVKVGLGNDVKGQWGGEKKMPSTRMGTAAMLREALQGARNYMKKQENAEKAPDFDLKQETLARVLRGELPLLVHAHRADDIYTALRISAEFGVTMILTTGTEAHKLAKELAARNVPVIVGPLAQARMKVDTAGRTIITPGVLAEHGVKVALTTDHPSTPSYMLPFSAGLAIRGGMDPQEALKAITINAAEIIGMGDRVGSLEVGKDADVLILDGHPLRLRSRIQTTIINGKVEYQL
jgi:imidazolonepropionase-like amidohydrolase